MLDVVGEIESKWQDSLGNNEKEIDEIVKEEGSPKKRKISHEYDIYYETLGGFAKNYQDAAFRDKRLKILTNASTLPKMNELVLKNSIEKVFHDLKLSYLAFHSTGTYVPTILEDLYDAAVANNVTTFEIILENDKLPSKFLDFLLNYEFPLQGWKSGENAPSDKIAHLAAINKSIEILECIVNKADINLDVQDCHGKSIFFYLVYQRPETPYKSSENVFLRLYEIERVRHEFPPNFVMLMALRLNYEHLFRATIDKYGADVNLPFKPDQDTTTTVLHVAISLKRAVMFDIILQRAPFPYVMDSRKRNCLHIACVVNFEQVIEKLINMCPIMLEQEDIDGDTPWMLAVNNDSLNAFTVIVKYINFNKQQRRRVEVLAVQHQSVKILAYLTT